MPAEGYRPHLHAAELEFWAAEPGEFQVFVDPNSRDVQMLRFEYTKTKR